MHNYQVTVNEGLKLDCYSKSLSLKKNDLCIVQYKQFKIYGRINQVNESGDSPKNFDINKAFQVLNRATLSEQSKANENNIRSKAKHRTCSELIKKHRLPMRLVATHLSFDQNLVIFMFTAPGRVDFRELLKDLNKSLKTRIELKQIGPRDQAAMVGGIGSCGRALCCSTFLTNFVSINVKMAKVQGLSLNPSNIMGACGRLKCCLSFEYEAYKDLVANMPAIGTACECDGCDGRVIERDPLKGEVKLKMSDKSLKVVHVSEINY